MSAIILRICKQMLNDKRALAMILLAPLLIMSFMYLVLGDSSYEPKIATKDLSPQIVQNLKKQPLKMIETNQEIDSLLEEKTVDAVIFMQAQTLTIRLLEPNTVVLQKIKTALNQINTGKETTQVANEVSFIYGSADASTFDGMIHVLLGIYSFFLVFLISGIAFVRERTLGTMERFMLAPISRYSVVGGFIIGYGIFAMIQSILLILFIMFVLGITITGSVSAILLVMTLLSLIAISTGSLVSVLAKNEFQVIQFIPIILTPQIFFSGIIPIETLPYGLDKVAQLMPIKYAASALNKIILQNGTSATILTELMVLTSFLLVLYFANTFLLKKYRAV